MPTYHSILCCHLCLLTQSWSITGSRETDFTLDKLIHLHPASLGWVPLVTTNPLPYPKKFLALADEILTHYCLPAEEPVRAWAPSGQPIYNLHYVNSMARVRTLLRRLDLIGGSRVQYQYAPLLASALVVSATVEAHCELVSVAIANANISARGSIRQAHDVIAWAGDGTNSGHWCGC